FAVLLSRYSNETDIVVGSPIAGRVHRDVEPLIGFFVNTLVLRSDLAAHPRFVELLASGKRAILDAYAHQHVPFEMLVEELRPERSLSHSPLFQILFVFQNRERGEARLGEARLEPLEESAGFVKLDLELNVLERENELALYWMYKKELFEAATIERMAASFGVLLESILENPEESVEALPLLTAAERSLLSAWQGEAEDRPERRPVHELFEAQVERAPDEIAVVFEDGRLTYRELNERSNRLAHALIQQGVGAETLVGLSAERSLEMLVGLLGILKAGGAYLPLDPQYPEARLRYMLEDSAAELVLTQSHLAELGCFAGRRTMPLDDPGLATEPASGNPGSRVRPSGLAYVIYTSGSTGQPKGVLVDHGQLAHTLAASLGELGWEAGDRMLCLAPFSFDIFLFELLSPLLAGGRCELIPLSPVLDVDRLVSLLPELTRLHAVPALMAQVVELAALSGARFPRLRTLFVGGEAVPAELLVRMREVFPAAELRVLYGPTEATIIATSWRVEAGQRPSASRIGRPLPGVEIRVCDRLGSPVPIGVNGEIRIGGPGVARGYLGREDLTAERFVANPGAAVAGSRWYRTGDLARWQSDGTVEFMGRLDHQVKVRGFRIELGEIEAQLQSHPSVWETVVLAREDRPGEKRLVGYVVGREGSTPDPDRLREHVASKLPEYMVPAVVVILDWLPLTANGKVDRKALPAPDAGDFQRSEHVAPRTELERRMCRIWEELLGLAQVGIDDNFFDLGGHSLLATQVVSQVRSALGLELPLRGVFENPTVRGLCERLPELRGGSVLPAIEVLARRERLALSYAQQRLWFIDRLEGASSGYNIPSSMRVTGGLDRAAFVRALCTIVERHESLRTVFQEVDGEVAQVIREKVDFRLTEKELGGLGAEEREREVRRLALEDARKPFDLSRDLLLRVSLLALSDEEHVVLLNMHHIASDGWSMGVLLRELGALYEACRAGRESPLAPLPVQYADYAQWQRRWLQGEVLENQLDYWRRHLAGLPQVHALPLDKPRPARQGFDGGHHIQRLPRTLKDRLELSCQRAGVTLFMILEAAFAVLLGRYSQESDVVVGSPIAGRVHRDVEPLIGFFVNTLVLRSDLAGNPRLIDLLESSKQMILDAYAHQHVPFEMLVEELRPERSLSHSPLFQILFVLQNAERGDPGLAGARLESIGGESGIVRFDLELSVWDLDHGLDLSWLYKKDLFHGATIERMASSYAVLLEGIAATLEERVEDLPLLTGAERHQIAVEWNATGSDYPREATLAELFAQEAALAPERTAWEYGREELSYGELDRRSNQVARFLVRHGVTPGDLVGLFMERSAALVVAIVGILKSGAAYLPLDPAYPAPRLALMLADSGSPLLLTQEHLTAALPETAARVVCLDAGWGEIAGESEAAVATGGTAADLAYVIYTSGSTGRPKGAAVPQRAVVRLV
ncbi:MAG TPA: amino acid adenylation domain-containing protein, partial [Thermoanaerobaculia bacterium]|nr:amino acid adenylation domain-containing protein [Thermoanaerobaculia bacterium]